MRDFHGNFVETLQVFSGLQESSKYSDFNTAVVWMNSVHTMISSYPNLCLMPFQTIPWAPTTITITVNFIFFWLSSFQVRSTNSFIISLSFILTLWTAGTAIIIIIIIIAVIIIIIINIIIIIIIFSFRVFHISVSWWFFTGVWVTASLLKSPGLISGFWLFSAMLSFG